MISRSGEVGLDETIFSIYFSGVFSEETLFKFPNLRPPIAKLFNRLGFYLPNAVFTVGASLVPSLLFPSF